MIKGSTLFLKTAWAIHKESLLALLAQISIAEDVSPEEDRSAKNVSYTIGKTGMQPLGAATEGSIAVIPLRGVMTKETDPWLERRYGWRGSDDLAQDVREAAANTNIKAIYIPTDTPGGQVAGVEQLGEAIQEAAGIKPVVQFVEYMCASGGVWAGAGATEVIMNGATAEMGSVGVKVSFWDMIPFFEKEGFKWIDVNADGSEDKNRAFNELRAGKPKRYKEEELNPLREVFHAHMKNTRGDKLNHEVKVLKGRMFIGEQAVEAGLADSIGTEESAWNRIVELANEHAQNHFKMNGLEKLGQTIADAIKNALGGNTSEASNLEKANAVLKENSIEGVELITTEQAGTLKDAEQTAAALQTAKLENSAQKGIISDVKKNLIEALKENNIEPEAQEGEDPVALDDMELNALCELATATLTKWGNGGDRGTHTTSKKDGDQHGKPDDSKYSFKNDVGAKVLDGMGLKH